MLLNEKIHTLTCNSAVQRITLDEERFTRTLAMCFQYIDCFHGILDIPSAVDCSYG